MGTKEKMARNDHQPSPELRVKLKGAAKKHLLPAPGGIRSFAIGKMSSGNR